MTFILVILTVAIIFSVELLMKTRRSAVRTSPGLVVDHQGPSIVSDRYFHPAHTWATVTNAQASVTVGADDFAERIMGTINGLEIPRVGQTLRQGEPFGKLHHGNRALVQTSPISGTVVEVNAKLLRTPTIVNESPLERGWIAKIKPSNLNADLRNLLSGSTADAWRTAVRTQLIQMFAPSVGTVLQDGGALIENFGNQLSDDQWNHVVQEFFPSVAETQIQNKPQN